MEESVSFFELKYLINDTFYYEISINNRTYGQAAGICYEAFYGDIVNDGIGGIVVRSEILMLKMRHKLNLSESDMKSMHYIIKKTKELDISRLLSVREREYFEEGLAAIKDKIMQLETKTDF